MRFLNIKPDDVTNLECEAEMPERVHQFDERTISAVDAALAANRPLLVRGEPGVGKSQLAEAVAIELDRAFYSFVVDSRTESRDMLWRFDAIMRLAEAQLYGTIHKGENISDKLSGELEKTLEDKLAVRNFVRPGPLWWAFDWKTAADACEKLSTPLKIERNEQCKENGWVVLIDEIDKAESDVPNGLLEALGSTQFTPFGQDEPVKIAGVAPLIIITTNEERVLPDAFVRRCLVLHLELPTKDNELIELLCKRGKVHFGKRTNDEVLTEAARQLVRDRKIADERQLKPLPGQAEYLDFVRAVVHLAPKKPKQQKTLLDSVAQLTLKKHPEMFRKPSGADE